VAAEDGSMSCAEVEVVKRLRAAGFRDAGWLATCGAVVWSDYQRPRALIRDEVATLVARRSLAIPTSGTGAPDVAALSGAYPIFVECKGGEALQDNQVAWVRAVLGPDELRRAFAVVIRRISSADGGRTVSRSAATPSQTRGLVDAPLDPALGRLLVAADAADNLDRIEFRDPIESLRPRRCRPAPRSDRARRPPTLCGRGARSDRSRAPG
jgi:hypothetical protein